LARTLFPLGEMRKPEVRALAAELGIPTATKHDSQEICFVPTGDYSAFIEAYLAEQGRVFQPAKGEIVDGQGKVLARHEGVHHYTVGQRKGLNVAAGEPLYVIQTDVRSGQVTVGKGEELLRRELGAAGGGEDPEPAPGGGGGVEAGGGAGGGGVRRAAAGDYAGAGGGLLRRRPRSGRRLD